MKSAALRGDYSKAALDYSVEQDWPSYTDADHALYRRLFERQAKLVPKYACPEWIEAISGLDAGAGIPKFDQVTRKLRSATGRNFEPNSVSMTLRVVRSNRRKPS